MKLILIFILCILSIQVSTRILKQKTTNLDINNVQDSQDNRAKRRMVKDFFKHYKEFSHGDGDIEAEDVNDKIHEEFNDKFEFNKDILKKLDDDEEKIECNAENTFKQKIQEFGTDINEIKIVHNIKAKDFIRVVDQGRMDPIQQPIVWKSYVGLDYVENTEDGIEYQVDIQEGIMTILLKSDDVIANGGLCDSVLLHIVIPWDRTIEIDETISNTQRNIKLQSVERLTNPTTLVDPMVCEADTQVYGAWNRGKIIGNVHTAIYEKKKVEVHSLCAYKKMKLAAGEKGKGFKINSGFRTNAEQKYLYSCYKTGKCNDGNEAAPPGWSNHQNGRALDVNVHQGRYKWYAKYGARYGFKRTVPSENWHWEFFKTLVDDGSEKCVGHGVHGKCGHVDTCLGTSVARVGCSGTAEIQCCIPAPSCTSPKGDGLCTPKSLCLGESVPKTGHCDGPGSYQCCVPFSLF